MDDSERSKFKHCFWTELEEEHLRQLAEHVPLRRIASMMGRTKGSVQWKVRDLKIRDCNYRNWEEVEIHKLALLRGMGLSYVEVGRILNCSPHACRKAFARHYEECIDVWRAYILAEIDQVLVDMGRGQRLRKKIKEALSEAFIPRYDVLFGGGQQESSSTPRTCLFFHTAPHTHPECMLRTYTLGVPFHIYRPSLG